VARADAAESEAGEGRRPVSAGPLRDRPCSATARPRGSDLSDFLAEEGIRSEVEVLALMRVVALVLQQILGEENLSKSDLPPA